LPDGRHPKLETIKFYLDQRKEEEAKLINIMMHKLQDEEKKTDIVKKFMRINTRKFQNAADKKNFEIESCDFDDACSRITKKVGRI
jgi:hypothetical protein